MIKIKNLYLYLFAFILFVTDIFLFGFFDQAIIALLFCFYSVMLFASSSTTLLIFILTLLACQSFLQANILGTTLIILTALSILALQLKNLLNKTKVLSSIFLVTAIATQELIINTFVFNTPFFSLFTALKLFVNLIIVLIFETIFSQR